MAEVVKKVGIKREAGWLYFIDQDGDISRVKMKRGGTKKKAKKGKAKTAAKRKAKAKTKAKGKTKSKAKSKAKKRKR